jgi:hypothetical protein
MQRFPLFVLLMPAIALASVAFVSGQISVPKPSAGTSAAKSVSQAGDDGWPKEVKSGDTNFRVHQPQMESWDGRNLTALSAIEIRMEGKEGTAYGAARFEAAARIDKAARVVDMESIRITKAMFPSMPDNDGLYLRILQNSVMRTVRQVSLDRFETALAVMEAEQKYKSYQLKHDPPQIVHSEVPAILVYVDGNPTYRPVRNMKIEHVVNTRPLILKTADGKHYLRLFDGWMESSTIKGPWAVCQNPPQELVQALKEAAPSGQFDLLEGKADPENKSPKPSLAKGPVPKIYIATVATELIVTEGKPEYTPIPGTPIAYAANTTGNIFRHTTEDRIYLLVSGRWFRSATLTGPWEFVPWSKLPPDFAKIPDDSPKENVKASIPGTQQALEAVIANHIPQTATVRRAQVKLNPPQFDGEPKLVPLEGTKLQYVINTATPILCADATNYYAVENGVWFKSASLKGPWTVADAVPATIYDIPPSAPLHFVTYVQIYGSTRETVDVGYTPGYYGTVTTTGSGYVVVYGTGYAYTPWVGTAWYGYPVTYGFGSSVVYTPWDGWAVSFGFGWSWGYPMYPAGWGWGPYPWWGPVGWGYYYPYPYYAPIYGGLAWGPGGAVAWGPGGWAGTTGNVYRRYGNTGAVTRTSQGFNAWTGNQWANRVGTAYNSKTGTIAAGQRAGVRNVYTGDYAYGSRGAITSGQTGNTITGGRITVGNSNTGQSGSAGYIRGENGGAIRVGDSIYAGKDGTVYRKGANGWEQNSGGGWGSVDRPASQNASNRSLENRPAQMESRQAGQMSNGQRIQGLEQQQAARSMGQTRTQSYRSLGSGGGARMGGGGRR